jgi:hypothetical protein
MAKIGSVILGAWPQAGQEVWPKNLLNGIGPKKSLYCMLKFEFDYPILGGWGMKSPSFHCCGRAIGCSTLKIWISNQCRLLCLCHKIFHCSTSSFGENI